MNELEILLPKYFSGEATQEERQAVEAWAQASTENQSEFVEYQNLWAGSASVTHKTYNAKAAWATISSQIATPPKAKIVERRQVWRWGIGTAAAAVIVFLLVGRLFFTQSSEESWQEVVAEKEVRQIQLPDGSKVWLKPGTRFRFPAQFEGDTRNMRLDGEAFFEVATDSSKPFIIQSEFVEVTVLGTSFNFSADSARALLTVKTGKVRFKGPLGDAVILTKGEVGSCDQLHPKVEERLNTDPNFMSWMTGIFEFDGVNIQQVIASLNTYYRSKPIVISKQAPADCAFSARFDQANIETVLEVLTATCSLHWTENAQHFEVVSE